MEHTKISARARLPCFVEIVGHLALAPELTAFHNWRIWHNYHHAKAQLRGVASDWLEKTLTRAAYQQSPLGGRARVRLGFGWRNARRRKGRRSPAAADEEPWSAAVRETAQSTD